MRTTTSSRCAAGAALLLAVAGCGGGGGGGGPSGLQHHDGGFFSVDAPAGWTVTTAGHCGTFGLLLQDPAEPLGKIFFFGAIGPVYMTQAAKDLDAYACSFSPPGQCPITWADAPVVTPLTPEAFMTAWPRIAAMKAATAFLPAFPRLEGLRIAATGARPAQVPGGATADLRGLFTDGAEVGEGMFLVTVTPFVVDTAYGNLICGVTAPKADFAARSALLVASLESFTVSQAYVDACLRESAAAWSAVAEAGRTLSEASDILWEGWEARTRSADILAEQYTDGFRGVDRVYDPSTGTVYEVPTGWYDDTYLPNHGSYQQGGILPLPDDDWDLWTKPTSDGSVIH